MNRRSSSSGLILTLDSQASGESAHQINMLVVRFTQRMGTIRCDRTTRSIAPGRSSPSMRAAVENAGRQKPTRAVGAWASSRSGSLPGPERAALGLALLVVRQLEIVLVGRRFEGTVGRVGDHDPFAAPARLVVLPDLLPLVLAALVVVDEVAEVVADVEEDAVVLGDDGAPRALGRLPIRLLLLGQHGVDLGAQRKLVHLQVLAGRRLFLLAAVGDVEHGDALGRRVLRELQRARNRQRRRSEE